MLFSGDAGKVAGAEKLDIEKADDAEREKEDKKEEYYLAALAGVADIHY
jgi:hypothetical protein